MRLLSWDEFNQCIYGFTKLLNDQEFSGVYGFPRGGLCLAVALSHSLNIPLLNKPETGSLVVDDIYETGTTLNSVRDLPGSIAIVWISKTQPTWWHSMEVIDSQEWLIFPWENATLAKADEKAYRISRGLADDS